MNVYYRNVAKLERVPAKISRAATTVLVRLDGKGRIVTRTMTTAPPILVKIEGSVKIEWVGIYVIATLDILY